MIQQSQFWVYIQKKWKLDLKEIPTFPYLLQHYSQLPSCENNLSVCQWMNGYKKMCVYICLGNQQGEFKVYMRMQMTWNVLDSHILKINEFEKLVNTKF